MGSKPSRVERSDYVLEIVKDLEKFTLDKCRHIIYSVYRGTSSLTDYDTIINLSDSVDQYSTDYDGLGYDVTQNLMISSSIYHDEMSIIDKTGKAVRVPMVKAEHNNVMDIAGDVYFDYELGVSVYVSIYTSIGGELNMQKTYLEWEKGTPFEFEKFPVNVGRNNTIISDLVVLDDGRLMLVGSDIKTKAQVMLAASLGSRGLDFHKRVVIGGLENGGRPGIQEWKEGVLRVLFADGTALDVTVEQYDDAVAGQSMEEIEGVSRIILTLPVQAIEGVSCKTKDLELYEIYARDNGGNFKPPVEETTTSSTTATLTPPLTDSEGYLGCGTRSLAFTDYRGKVSMTESGYDCQSWSKDTVHTSYYNSEEYTELEENFCRNPKGEGDRAWCYTINPDVRWEYCDVPECGGSKLTACDLRLSRRCWCPADKGRSYAGEKNWAEDDSWCRRWLLFDGYGDYPDRKCRGTPNSQRPWCFTNSSGTWAYCDIPSCGCADYDGYICGCRHNRQRDYNGTINTTIGGYTCQKWSSQHPHTHKYDPEAIENQGFGLDENYCRNPSRSERAWCFVDDPYVRFQYCDVPYCDEINLIE